MPEFKSPLALLHRSGARGAMTDVHISVCSLLFFFHPLLLSLFVTSFVTFYGELRP